MAKEKEKPVNCPYIECLSHEGCTILEITGKIPKSFDACSYSKNIKKDEKQKKKAIKSAGEFEEFKKKKKKER